MKEASFEERHKLEKAYKERLKVMDAKLREVSPLSALLNPNYPVRLNQTSAQ